LVERASRVLYSRIILNAMQLAYLDALMGLALVAAAMVPLVWFIRRPIAR
jgi:hypothetical protein